MTGRIAVTAFGLCVTVFGVVDGWSWPWMVLNVAIDLCNIIGLIAAAQRDGQ